jgi:hypothetical protein
MAAAASRYRQVRLTITEEAGNRITVRVLVKPLDASWTMRHSVWHHSWRRSRSSGHWSGLIAEAFYAIVGEQLPTPHD